MISLQDIFNKAWEEFIVKDGEPGVEQGGPDNLYRCRYKTKDGRKCAVGLALPDSFPFSKHPDTSFDAIVEAYPGLFTEKVRKTDCGDLSCFQYRLHDNLIDKNNGEWSYSKEERKQQYIKTAKEYGLEVPE